MSAPYIPATALSGALFPCPARSTQGFRRAAMSALIRAIRASPTASFGVVVPFLRDVAE